MEETTEDTITTFFRTGHPLKFSKHELVLGCDTRPDGIYLIETGFVKEYGISDSGEEIVHLIYKPGEIFPFSWGYLGINPGLFFEAVTEALLWRVSREQFHFFARESLRLSNALSAQLAWQHHWFTLRLDTLSHKSTRNRVIHRLIILASRFGKSRSGTIPIGLPTTHETLAASINMTRESVSRELEKLQHENMISHEGRCIIILDIRQLNNLLDTPVDLELYALEA